MQLGWYFFFIIWRWRLMCNFRIVSPAHCHRFIVANRSCVRTRSHPKSALHTIINVYYTVQFLMQPFYFRPTSFFTMIRWFVHRCCCWWWHLNAWNFDEHKWIIWSSHKTSRMLVLCVCRCVVLNCDLKSIAKTYTFFSSFSLFLYRNQLVQRVCFFLWCPYHVHCCIFGRAKWFLANAEPRPFSILLVIYIIRCVVVCALIILM